MAQRYGFLAFLSFFIPGLGQLIKGELGKGVAIMIFIIGGWILFFEYIAVMHTIFLSVTVFLALTALWAWNIYDAYTY